MTARCWIIEDALPSSVLREAAGTKAPLGTLLRRAAVSHHRDIGEIALDLQGDRREFSLEPGPIVLRSSKLVVATTGRIGAFIDEVLPAESVLDRVNTPSGSSPP